MLDKIVELRATITNLSIPPCYIVRTDCMVGGFAKKHFLSYYARQTETDNKQAQDSSSWPTKNRQANADRKLEPRLYVLGPKPYV